MSTEPNLDPKPFPARNATGQTARHGTPPLSPWAFLIIAFVFFQTVQIAKPPVRPTIESTSIFLLLYLEN